MSASTKVILAIVGVLVGILIIYYGFMLPGPEPAGAAANDEGALIPPDDPAASAPLTRNAIVLQPETLAPVRDETGTMPQGLLSSALRNASRDPVVTDPPDVLPRDPVPTPSTARPAPAVSDPLTTTPPVTTPADPKPPITMEYTIRSGDTLSSIASQWFGNAEKWDLIAHANPGIDPHRLRVGQRITLPSRDTQRTEVPRAGRESRIHIVKSGDTLSGLAKAYYGNGGLWERIYVANTLTLDHDPNALQVGMKLIIPPTPY